MKQIGNKSGNISQHKQKFFFPRFLQVDVAVSQSKKKMFNTLCYVYVFVEDNIEPLCISNLLLSLELITKIVIFRIIQQNFRLLM